MKRKALSRDEIEPSFFVITLGMSDSLAVSDIMHPRLALLVRFFRIIGHHASAMCAACPILPHYRTSSDRDPLCLSDSSTLSDIMHPRHALLVRFFRDIGHPATADVLCYFAFRSG